MKYSLYNCKFCGKEFTAPSYRKRKVCTLSCNAQWLHKYRGIGFKKGEKVRLGIPHTEKYKNKRRGSGNPYWKGDKVNHHSLHSWIKDNWKKKLKCEICKTTRRDTIYDWSNKDHKYSRERNDWWVLCRKCHMKYDFENLNRRIGIKVK